jgi:hypothetical protein
MSVLVPIHIARHVLSIKEVNVFKTYLCLKSRCSGKIKLSSLIIQEISKQLRCNVKTVQNHLKKLHQWDWIGYNPDSGYYFIRGWERIQFIEKIDHAGRSCAIIEISDLNNLKEFLFAAVTQKLIRYKRYTCRQAAQLKPRAIQPSPALYPFAIRYYSEALHLSIRTVHLLKQNTIKAGFMLAKPNYSECQIELDSFWLLKEYVTPGEFYMIQDRQIKIRLPDLIYSNVKIVKWKKSKQ